MPSDLHLNPKQRQAAAKCILALRTLPPEDRMDVVVLLAKALCEDRIGDAFFGVEPAHGSNSGNDLPR
jgi:hypothetical protein